eukprot:5674049-Pyramimonas_sp.AAC.1
MPARVSHGHLRGILGTMFSRELDAPYLFGHPPIAAAIEGHEKSWEVKYVTFVEGVRDMVELASDTLSDLEREKRHRAGRRNSYVRGEEQFVLRPVPCRRHGGDVGVLDVVARRRHEDRQRRIGTQEEGG